VYYTAHHRWNFLGIIHIIHVSNPCIIGIKPVLYVLNSALRSRAFISECAKTWQPGIMVGLVPNWPLALLTQIPETRKWDTYLSVICKHDTCDMPRRYSASKLISIAVDLLITVCCNKNCSRVFWDINKCCLASFGANCTLIIPDSVMRWLIRYWYGVITAKTVLWAIFWKIWLQFLLQHTVWGQILYWIYSTNPGFHTEFNTCNLTNRRYRKFHTV
jgi:hypothetical protein